MTAPDLTPAAAQVEDWLAVNHPGGPAARRPLLALAVWSVAEFRELVAHEAGPLIADIMPGLSGLPLREAPAFRKGYAMIREAGHDRAGFDFTANLAAREHGIPRRAWREPTAGAALHVIDGHGCLVRVRGLDDLPPRHLLEQIEELVNQWFEAGVGDASTDDNNLAAAIRTAARLGLEIRSGLE